MAEITNAQLHAGVRVFQEWQTAPAGVFPETLVRNIFAAFNAAQDTPVHVVGDHDQDIAAAMVEALGQGASPTIEVVGAGDTLAGSGGGGEDATEHLIEPETNPTTV